MTESTYVAIDIGYGFSKAIALSPDGQERGPIVLPSSYAQVGRILTEDAKEQRPRLIVDGRTYYYGSGVRFARDPVYTRARKRPPALIKVLFLALLSELRIDGPIHLISALPVEWLQDAPTFRNILRGPQAGFRVDLGQHTAVNVTTVDVYPQPQATFLSRAKDAPDLWHDWSTVLIIDVGTGTTNVSLVAGGEWIDERASSFPYGMGHVLEQALQKQEQEQGGRDLLHIARAKLWACEKQSLEWAAPALRGLATRIGQAIGDVVGDILVTRTVLAGGGATFVKPFLSLPGGEPDVSESPELDNISGLLAVAHFQRAEAMAQGG